MIFQFLRKRVKQLTNVIDRLVAELIGSREFAVGGNFVFKFGFEVEKTVKRFDRMMIKIGRME